MKLHWSPRSPFVRKVMIAFHECGLADSIERVRNPVTMQAPPNPKVIVDNPLGKIPVLVLDDGRVLFDSSVICAYLDGISPETGLIPKDFDRRIECLRWEAFGDGLMETLLLWRIEVGRGEHCSPVISDGFAVKVTAALARLETEVPALDARPFAIGHAALLCALGQLDFRYPACGWHEAHPDLSAWQARHLTRPSLVATEVIDDRALNMGEVVMPLKLAPRA